MTGAGGAAGAGAAAAAAAAIANAIKASGVLVNLDPDEWEKVLRHATDPLVVTAEGGFFSTTYLYLFSYEGLAFHTKSREPLVLPERTRTVRARKIWIPG
jgi:hypothetical protein